MTFLENKLLEIFRACSDEQKFKILELANLISTFPDPAPVPPPSASDPAPVQTSTRVRDTANKAEIPDRYQMTTYDIYELMDIIRYDGGDPFDALCFAFDYGFVKGNRATRRGKCKNL